MTTAMNIISVATAPLSSNSEIHRRRLQQTLHDKNAIANNNAARLRVANANQAKPSQNNSLQASSNLLNLESSTSHLRSFNVSPARLHHSIYRPPTTRNCYFVRAGSGSYVKIVRMPVNRQKYRTLDALLDDLSHKIPDLPFGVRKVCTLPERRLVCDLAELENNASYVCTDKMDRRPTVDLKRFHEFLSRQKTLENNRLFHSMQNLRVASGGGQKKKKKRKQAEIIARSLSKSPSRSPAQKPVAPRASNHLQVANAATTSKNRSKSADNIPIPFKKITSKVYSTSNVTTTKKVQAKKQINKTNVLNKTPFTTKLIKKKTTTNVAAKALPKTKKKKKPKQKPLIGLLPTPARSISPDKIAPKLNNQRDAGAKRAQPVGTVPAAKTDDLFPQPKTRSQSNPNLATAAAVGVGVGAVAASTSLFAPERQSAQSASTAAMLFDTKPPEASNQSIKSISGLPSSQTRPENPIAGVLQRANSSPNLRSADNVPSETGTSLAFGSGLGRGVVNGSPEERNSFGLGLGFDSGSAERTGNSQASRPQGLRSGEGSNPRDSAAARESEQLLNGVDVEEYDEEAEAQASGSEAEEEESEEVEQRDANAAGEANRAASNHPDEIDNFFDSATSRRHSRASQSLPRLPTNNATQSIGGRVASQSHPVESMLIESHAGSTISYHSDESRRASNNNSLAAGTPPQARPSRNPLTPLDAKRLKHVQRGRMVARDIDKDNYILPSNASQSSSSSSIIGQSRHQSIVASHRSETGQDASSNQQRHSRESSAARRSSQGTNHESTSAKAEQLEQIRQQMHHQNGEASHLQQSTSVGVDRRASNASTNAKGGQKRNSKDSSAHQSDSGISLMV